MKAFVDTAETFVKVRQVTSEPSICNHFLLATSLQFFPHLGGELVGASESFFGSSFQTLPGL